MKDQAKIVKKARERLGLTTAELAAKLGKSIHTVQAWMEPEDSKSWRNMPESAKLLLDHILADAKAKGAGAKK